MESLLKKIRESNILLEVVDGRLNVYSKAGDPDQELLSEIRDRKDQLLQFLLNSGRADRDNAGDRPIPVIADAASYAVSSSQFRLWTLCHAGAANPAYNVPGAYLLEGRLDVPALEAAFRSLIARHEILRTGFGLDQRGEVRQWVAKAEDIVFEVPCYTINEDRQWREKLLARIHRDAIEPFDLAVAPLIRVRLYRVNDRRHILTVVMHHITTDEWSMKILVKELSLLYDSVTAGQQTALPALRIQYKDYAAWQQHLLASGALHDHKRYWVDVLSGEIPVFDLLGDNTRPSARAFAGGTVSQKISTKHYTALRELCHQHNCTLFMGLVALLNAFLYRYTGSEDIVIGTPVAGREHADLGDQIGPYMNTIALRTRFSGNEGFTAILNRVKQVVLAAHANQSYPFDELIETLGISYDGSRNPLFDIMVVYQHSFTGKVPEGIRTGGLTIQEFGYRPASGKLDLLFQFEASDSEFWLHLDYDRNLFAPETIARMARQLDQFAAALCEQPEQPVAQAAYLSEQETAELLHRFNATGRDHSPRSTIIDLFEGQLVSNGSRRAMLFNEKEFTFKELDRLANRLAGYLRREHGIGRNDLVAIRLERSEWMVIAILAVFKAGAAYVPVDPQFPEERIAYILGDCRCKAVIDQEQIGRFVDDAGRYSEAPPPRQSEPSDLAYVIYTSGSTGVPKGCMLEHRGLINRLDWMWQELGFNETDVILQKTSFTFDVSVWELLMPLCWGGTMILCTSEDARSPHAILSLIERHKVTSLHFVPGMLNSFIQSMADDPGYKDKLGSLRRVITSGDILTPATVANWYERAGAPIINLYGPTEASIDVTFSVCSKDAGRTLIGKPIWNTRIYILDPGGRLVSIGVAGEICIAGIGLSKGYLNKPELTAERFVADPFRPEEKMYRTGDIGRWSSGGEIEFLGRRDNQVKVRGYRVELGEVQQAMMKVEGVNDAMVIAQKNEYGDNELIAYFTDGKGLDTSFLRAALGRSLPVYMVPAYFVQLDTFPLTPSGKVDRQRLPAVAQTAVTGGRPYAAAGNITEDKLVKLWQQLLGMEQIGVEDDFYELGGQSLKAIRLVSLINREFGIRVDLHELFKARSVKQQARLILHGSRPERGGIDPAPRQNGYALSSSQRRIWIVSQHKEASIAYNIPGAYTVEGELNVPALEYGLQQLITRHEILRTVFSMNGSGELLAITSDSHGSVLASFDLRDEEDIDAALAARIDEACRQPFDLATGPLLRVALYRTGPDKWIFFFVLHHIIADAWSIELLMKELMQHYVAYAAGKEEQPAALAFQYKDYAYWQQQRLHNGAMTDQMDYWMARLSGDLPVLDLPSALRRPAVRTYNGTITRMTLDRESVRQLQALSRRMGATLFMGLLAVIKALVYKYSGHEDILIGSPIAGRDVAELEDQIGCYLNLVALRTAISDEDTFRTLLVRVKQITLEAYEHGAYPFDELVGRLSPRQDKGRDVVFDLFMDLHEADEVGWDRLFCGCTVRPYELPRHSVSKFDLTLLFTQTPDDLHLLCEYNTDVYDAGTAELFLQRLAWLLRSVVTNPDIQLRRTTMADDEERHKLLIEFNNGLLPVPDTRTVLQLFAARALEHPDRVAITYKDTDLTYAGLERESHKLAVHLQKRYGVRANEPVGIMLDRSGKAIIAILAILRSGAAFVPVDPDYPLQRREYLLRHTGMRLLLTQTDYLFDVGRFDGEVFAMDIQTIEGADGSIGLQPPMTGLAYIVYTSGSTGVPKGCMITHGNLSNYIQWADRYYFGDSGQACFPLFTSLSFDLTITSIFCPLTTGGRIVIFDQREELPGVLEACFSPLNGINAIKLTPSHIDILKSMELTSSVISCAILGGEEVTVQHIRTLKNIHPDMRIYNEYGPTETTVGCIAKQLQPEEPVLIGKPIAGTSVYIVNKANELCPTLVTGELCICGAGVGLGYWNEPEMTAARFQNDLYSSGGRMYRTGDLGRWLPGGDIQFLGRMDDQVKRRGYRIEPGEVENVLRQEPGVDAAVVVGAHTGDTKGELIAYVVLHAGGEAGDLRSGLAAKLPEFMLPDSIVVLNEIPLTINGKLDRKRLPMPDDKAPLNGVEYIAPRDRMEEQLVLIWQEALTAERIGVRDNFFSQGGDSIKAMTCLVAIKKAFKVEVGVDLLYEYPTIEKCAAMLRDPEYTQRPPLSEAIAAGLREIGAIRRRIEEEDLDKHRLPAQFEDIYPLVPIEEGMIYSSMSDPEEPVYYDQFSYLIEIRDIGQFRVALKGLVRRHNMLRTKYFMTTFSQPVKVVLPEIELPLSYEDLSDWSEEGGAAHIRQYFLTELGRRSTFDNELLWKIKLFRVAEDRYQVTYCFHHALLDGWSVSVFQTELSNFSGKEPPMPASTYKDYCALRLGRRKEPGVDAYWRRTLQGYTRNKLPFNYRGTKITNDSGMRTVVAYPGQDLLRRLDKTASANQVSFKSLCVAAHILLLHVVCSEKDVITGIVTHERPEIEDSVHILGCFLNTLPTRIGIDPEDDLLSIIRKVNGSMAEMKRYEVHLSEVARIIDDKTSAANPIFDTILNYTEFHEFSKLSRQLYSGLRIADADVSYEMTNTLFDVEVDKTLDHFTVRIKYAAAYFQEGNVRSALDLYIRILEQMADLVHCRIASLKTLDEAALQEILFGFNDTKTSFAADTTIDRLFEEQVSRTPDAIALSQDGEGLSYSLLNGRANRLAWLLIDKGVHPGDNIGLVVTRSPQMVIGMIGILKAGCAYIPIDPEYPLERQQYIAGNSNAVLLVTDGAYPLTDSFFPLGSVHIDDSREGYESHNPDLHIESTRLAYTIYTSGSTGRPKGVMIEHRSAVNLLQWVNRTFRIGRNDRLLFLTSMCFDLSVYDIFGILCAGGTVVIARHEELQDMERLQRLLREQRITFWDSVPTTINYLIRELEAGDMRFCQTDLRLVFLSGDWIPVDLPDRIKRFFPQAAVISLGGATEGTVWSNYYPIGTVDKGWTSIPYGKPIANNFFYILNEHLQPVPKGIVGELYIGGIGVAQGYANDRERTDRAFVANPFDADLGGRMYRTGDLGRMMADGNMEFLGRKDNQVKIRGFRVELGEIESVLQKHPDVLEAIVHLYRGAGDRQQLCAYLVLAKEIDEQRIRDYLRGYLPAYMIPDRCMFLSALPLNSNGKIDRKALPDPGQLVGAGSQTFFAATTGSEIRIEATWRDILNIGRISVRQDLFELGANSLSVAAFVNRVRREMQLSLSIRDVFAHPTIEGIARRLSMMAADVSGLIPAAARQSSYVLSAQQMELWISGQFSQVNVAFNMPAIFQLEGDLVLPALERAVDRLVERHEILRTVFREIASGQVRQFVRQPREAGIGIRYSDLRGEDAVMEKLAVLAREEFTRPFDLAAGPLIRLSLIRIATDRWALVYTMHHIIADGLSMVILSRELATAYNAFLRGEEAHLPPLRIHYKDFAVWQQAGLQSERMQEHKRYWLRQLEDPPSALELPMAGQRNKPKTYRGAVMGRKFGRRLTEDLKAAILRQQDSATVFMGLYAAVNMLLYRYTGRTDIVLGTSLSGRDLAELEGQIGYFLNTLPLRMRFNREDRFPDLLARARTVILDADEHQRYSLENLMGDLMPDTHVNMYDLFNVFIVTRDIRLNRSVSDPRFGDLTIKEYQDIGYPFSKFDLTFIFNEAGEELMLDIEFRADLFQPEQISEMLDDFGKMMEEVLQDPERAVCRVSSVPLIGDPMAAQHAGQAFTSPIETEF